MQIHPPGSTEHTAAKRRRDAANHQVAGDALPADEPAPMTYEQTEKKVHELWNAGYKIEAMEVALGRPIGAQDMVDDPDLALIYMMPNADDAFGAMLMVRNMPEAQAAGEANPEHVRIVADLLKDE